MAVNPQWVIQRTAKGQLTTASRDTSSYWSRFCKKLNHAVPLARSACSLVMAVFDTVGPCRRQNRTPLHLANTQVRRMGSHGLEICSKF